MYTGYHGTSEIEHGSSACTVDNPLDRRSAIISPYRRSKHALSLTLDIKVFNTTWNCMIKTEENVNIFFTVNCEDNVKFIYH